MASLWIWTRCQWRRRLGGALAVTVLFAVALAVVLTAAAGARRTQTAYPRMVEAVGAGDLLVNPDLGVDTELDFDAVEALPGVAGLGVTAGMYAVPPDDRGRPDFALPMMSLASADGEAAYTIDRPLLTDGRLPDPDAVEEVLVDPELAELLDVSVGDETTVLVPDLSSPPTEDQEPEFVPLPVTVTGIGLSTSQILTDETFDLRVMTLTPAFFEAYRPAVGYWGLSVDLEDASPEGIAAFRRSVDALVPDEGIEYRSQAVDDDAVARAVEPQVFAVAAFAALVALAAIVVVAQAMVRPLVLDRDEARTLQAVGLTRRTLFAGGMLRTVLLATIAALGAIGLATAASSRFPTGFVQRAEPSPGTDLNLAIVGGGAAIAVVLVTVLVALPIWRGAGLRATDTAVRRPGRTVEALRSWGVGPAAVSGVHFALEPRPGRSAGRVWSSLLGGALVVAIASAAITFGASLTHLVDDPALYGWAWDASAATSGRLPTVEQALDADERVARWSRLSFNRLVLDDVTIPAVGVSPVADAITPTIVEGTAPTGPDQVVLGNRTMERLGTSIGDQVTATAPDGTDHPLTVVGVAVFPGIGTYSGSERTELGTGAMVTLGALDDLGPPVDKGALVIDLAPDVDRDAFRAETESLLLAADRDADEAVVAITAERPTDIVALDRVRDAPWLVARLLALLMLTQIAVALVAAARARRRDLALLKTVGFVRRQAAATMGWQSITALTIAVVLGAPVGVALGRALWTALGDRLGVVPAAVTPVGPLLVLTAALFLGGGLISLAGGALLARTTPASALRSE